MKKTTTKLTSALLALILAVTLFPVTGFASTSTVTFENCVTITNVTSQTDGATDDWRADHYSLYNQVDKTSLKTFNTTSPTVLTLDPNGVGPNGASRASVAITTRNRSGVIELTEMFDIYTTTLTDGQYFVEVNYPSSSTRNPRRAIFYLNVGTAEAPEPRMLNDNHPIFSNLDSYTPSQIEAYELVCPEMKEWVQFRIGTRNSGCYDTARQFALDVFGTLPPISSDMNYYTDFERFGSVWQFIPFTRGMILEAGDIIIEYGTGNRLSNNLGHVSVMLGEYPLGGDSDGRAFLVAESSGNVPEPCIYLGSVFISADGGTANLLSSHIGGVLRPDWTQAKANQPAPEAPNLDTASAWARDSINAAIEKGFVPLDIRDNYQSDITRQEFCRMAVMWLEYKLGKSIDEIVAERGMPERMGHTFSDTSDPNILAAYRLGVTSGTVAPTADKPGQFTPNGTFDRQSAATMLRSACKVAGMEVDDWPDAGFADMDSIALWAQPGVNFCRANGIMSGDGTNFNPGELYSRQHSIITFYNIK